MRFISSCNNFNRTSFEVGITGGGGSIGSTGKACSGSTEVGIAGDIGSTGKACSESTNGISAGATATSTDMCFSACSSCAAMVWSEIVDSGPVGGDVGVSSREAEVLGFREDRGALDTISSIRAFFFWYHFSLAPSRALDKRVLAFLQLL